MGCDCEKFIQTKYSKYKSQKSVFDDITFDSKYEGRFYGELLIQQKAGLIKEIQRQVNIPLIVNGKIICTYKADFIVTYKNGDKELIETKGVQTPDFRIKWKLLDALWSVEFPAIKRTLVFEKQKYGLRNFRKQ
jgi:hypothetical protein